MGHMMTLVSGISILVSYIPYCTECSAISGTYTVHQYMRYFVCSTFYAPHNSYDCRNNTIWQI